ncbi:hypothetical protein G6701_03315 [Polynucleobacter paneuropaeus]|nr:hypothetical protein [Polynucleobacter paneuropaeus]MBT8585697.1 hypothetical protein [Polynucleobacter paneuropaeus]
MLAMTLFQSDLNDRQSIPEWVTTFLCILFSVLWAVTGLPHLLSVEYFCLAIGAALGLYVVIRNLALLSSSKSASLCCIAILFIWIVSHLFFIGRNYQLQLLELQSIWKRALLGSIFALGLGLSIVRSSNPSKKWQIIFAGLFLPTVIFYIKYIASIILPFWGIEVPEPLRLYSYFAEFYVPKITYVFFCLPCMAVAIGALVRGLKTPTFSLKKILFLAFLIISIFGLFLLENIKNGFAYGVILLMIAIAVILRNKIFYLGFFKSAVLIVCVVILSILIYKNIEKNDSWKSFYYDLKVSIKENPFSPNSYLVTGEYPINERGVTVQPANYARFSWGIAAINLISKNPLGYGLVHASFGHLIQEVYPDSKLSQSHSGWLDLTLGIGIPGVLLLLIGGVLAIKNSQNLAGSWNNFGLLFLGSMILLAITTEVSQKNYVNTFVWSIVFVTGLGIGQEKLNLSSKSNA